MFVQMIQWIHQGRPVVLREIGSPANDPQITHVPTFHLNAQLIGVFLSFHRILANWRHFSSLESVSIDSLHQGNFPRPRFRKNIDISNKIKREEEGAERRFPTYELPLCYRPALSATEQRRVSDEKLGHWAWIVC